MSVIEKPIHTGDRLISLDFFRGLTMFLLVASFTNLFSSLTAPEYEGTFLYSVGLQFQHVAWEGLRFYDLIQPFFMFIVGVAIPYSYANRIKRGLNHGQIRKHVFERAFLLLLFGWALACISEGKIVFYFQNVLAQLSVTYLLAFLIMKKSATTQIIISFLLLAVTEALYRGFPIEGFNHPFVPNENFGTWLDLQYGGANLVGHWVSFNAIPTTAHTIWGVLTAQLLMSDRQPMRKFKVLLIAGVVLMVAGYALSPVTPIIKRICTSTFVMASGGWTILALAFSYWLIDIKKYKNWTLFFAIVGMNSLFIYLFAHVGGTGLIRSVIAPFTMSVSGLIGESAAKIGTNFIVLFLLWYICYWLYKRRIFIKI
ncbi:MAG: membrane protein [Cyclobacteriaceae bacterium]|nr:MAG: membrane protein [Cyclobacteriaceae bacterium]